MAFGRAGKVDGRRNSSSSLCSTTTVVVFVALCLVAVWMISSSTIVPVEVSSGDNSDADVKSRAGMTDSVTFEDGSTGVVEDLDRGGDLGETNRDPVVQDKSEEQPWQKVQEEAPVHADGKDRKDGMERPFEDRNGNGEGQQQPDGANQDGSRDETSGDANNFQEKISELTDGNYGGGQQKGDDDNAGENERNAPGEKPLQFEDNDSKSKTEVFPDGAASELLNETSSGNGAWSTQAAESNTEKEAQATSSPAADIGWKLCKVPSGPDYIPCLDNEEAIKKLKSTKHYEHRERHCPTEPPTCLVPLPAGYKSSIPWPISREKVWFSNVPHPMLVAVKGHQNWVKVSGEYLTFPGGGTQFKRGALHYIDFIQQSIPSILWGKRSRVVLDVGCGVASFGGFLFDRDVLTMSFAPKDEHEAQVQFALERGIPALSAVMGTKRLPFPGLVFDVIHCARCRVPWHIEGGKLLLELNRLLRPGGYFVWSATPVYQKLSDDVEIWNAMSALTKSMCWELVNKTKDRINEVGMAIYRKPMDNQCYERRTEANPPLCQESDDSNAAWNITLQACVHKLPTDPAMRGSRWPEEWPQRLEKTPYWLDSSKPGVYGKPASEDFTADYEHWKRVVSKSYVNGMGIDWSKVRNVMDMRSLYGGFAAALQDKNVWVMNVVPIDSADTLPIIYERGLFGMYHDWCESFSTYPRSYDLLHADHLFSLVKKRCKLLPTIVEVDRILRPQGSMIVRDNVETINEMEALAKSLSWEIQMTYTKDNEGLLCIRKTMWRPSQ